MNIAKFLAEFFNWPMIGVFLVVAIALVMYWCHRDIPWQTLLEGMSTGCTWCQDNSLTALGIGVGIWLVGLVVLPYSLSLAWGVGGMIVLASWALALRSTALSSLDDIWRK